MRKSIALLAITASAALVFAACGGSSEQSVAGGTCSDVSLGTFEGQTWSASEIEGVDVPCDTAQAVAKQWAAQQVGGPQAKLPRGWSCDSSSVCRKGRSRVTFALKFEG